MTPAAARLYATTTAVLATSLLSAQTFVVDASNGPGTSFMSLLAAVPAVPDGATLIVRSGDYGGFTLTGKGLTILCEPNVNMIGSVRIDNIAPTQSVVVRDMRWSSAQVAPGEPYLIELSSCAGPVHLEGVTASHSTGCLAGPSGCIETQTLRAQSCDQLTLRFCEMFSSFIMASTVAIESCELFGDLVGSIATQPPTAIPLRALDVWFSDVVISGSPRIRGSWGWYYSSTVYQNGAAGIDTLASNVRILDGAVEAGGTLFAPVSQYAIRATGGSVRIDPRATLTPFNSQSGILGPHQVSPMPVVVATSDASPGLLTVVCDTQSSDLVVLVVGLPASPTSLPGLADPFWISNSAFAWQAAGTHTSNTPVTASLTVPPGFQGLRLGWHAVAFGPVTGFQNSNPSTSLIY